MRTLLFHYNPAASGLGGGGAESNVRDLMAGLRALGHEVGIAHSNIQTAYNHFSPDIIHFHTIHASADGLAPLIWAQKKGIPHCLSLHDYWPFCFGRMLLRHDDQPCTAVKGVCDRDCDQGPAPIEYSQVVNRSPVVVFNPHSAAIYRRNGIRVDAIISHGIDTDFFCPDYDKRPKDVRIICTSAWPEYPTKGVHVLTKAAKLAKVNVDLVAHLPRARVRDELQAAHIFVFPSCYEETWGLCLTEAMSSGCACIASDVAGARSQIVSNVTGLLVPPRDPCALADAMQYMIDHPVLRNAMGKTAREVCIRNRSYLTMAEYYVKLYSGLVRSTK